MVKPAQRPTYRPDLFVADKTVRHIQAELTPAEWAILDKRARELNLARGALARDLIVNGLVEAKLRVE